MPAAFGTFGTESDADRLPETNPADSAEARVTWRLFPVSLTLMLAAVALVLSKPQTLGGEIVFETRTDGSNPSSNPSISLSNEYERDVLGHPLADGKLWDYLVQRHKPTLLQIEDSDYEHCFAAWSITDPEGVVTEAQIGSQIVITLTAHGIHQLDLKMACNDDQPPTTYSYSVMSKHVRYEIRSLSEHDRGEFFDALEIVYNTNQKDGEAMYGKKYRSIEYLVREHLYGAADKQCDHWHDDAGIYTHHMAFTLEMEQSLQSIKPTITLPYWDYTIDAYKYSEDFTASPIFDDSWFGPVGNDAGDTNHAIQSGIWAYQKVMKRADEYSEIHNPYGLLRSPWNTNPAPYVLRDRYTLGVKDGGWTVPNCADFDEVSVFDWIGDFFSAINGELHGPIHIMIGGMWFFEDNKYNISQGLIDYLGSSGKQLSDGFLLASKFLWRQGYVRCPEVCSDDTPETECVCYCPTEIIANQSANHILRETGIANAIDDFVDATFLEELGMTETELLDFLCHVGHPGEMFTSAAPYDPTFWPLHGVAERFMSYKRIASRENITTLNETWGYRHSTTMSDTHVVCDWSAVTPGSMEMPTCIKGASCSGHAKDDLLPMGGFIDGNEKYTNEEFWKFIAPWNDDLPYVYDSYSNWTACEKLGISFFTKDTTSTLSSSSPASSLGGIF